MTDAASWLERLTADAPAHLRRRMLDALAESAQGPAADQLADAALSCLQAALQEPDGPDAALHLLSADALLTHACAAAAEQGDGELARFTAALDANRFQQLLERKP
jgi:hypothetical protein